MPKNYLFFILLVSGLLPLPVSAKRKEFIYTKEGKPVLNRKEMIDNCLKATNKNERVCRKG